MGKSLRAVNPGTKRHLPDTPRRSAPTKLASKGALYANTSHPAKEAARRGHSSPKVGALATPAGVMPWMACASGQSSARTGRTSKSSSTVPARSTSGDLKQLAVRRVQTRGFGIEESETRPWLAGEGRSSIPPSWNIPPLQDDNAAIKEHAMDSQPTCPLEIKVELLLELMGLVAARLGRLADAEPSPENRAECLKALDIVLDKRFQFDPDNRGQVEALTAEFDSYAEILKRKLQRVEESARATG
ncbi:hypothetical protein [Azohydromonas australica]|uniref:hypothetical protein n=1 Tax=Azohydromonas australica TaxID=364039 RepID=UPI0012EBB7EB|nr:hypothetical protein [Azohydromonas australica]